MSYLLDALRKAERERNEDRVPDLARIHEPDADGPRGGRADWVLPVVAGLVLLNAGVLLMFWVTEQGVTDAVRSSPHPTRASDGAPPEPMSEPRPVETTPSPAPEPAPAPAETSPEPAAPAPSDDVPARPPPIELSGHLYSSIPGRSFVLVNGRRYREGERLREGPAVESIDESGAVFNYRGERFRAAAPR